MSLFVVPAPRSCPGRRGVPPRGEACCSGPCFGRCTLCGWGSVYAYTAWRLSFNLWFRRCSLCAVTGSGPVPGRWCSAAVCCCSSCFGYTPCAPGSGYPGVLRYLQFGLWRWHCSWYVVMGFRLVPVPVGVLSLPPLSSSPLWAWLCWQCWGHGSCGLGSLVPGACCVPRGWGVRGGILVHAPGSWGRRDHRGQPDVVSPFGSLLMSACSRCGFSSWALSSWCSCFIVSCVCIACVVFLARHVCGRGGTACTCTSYYTAACCHMCMCTIYGTGRWHTSCPWLRCLLDSVCLL